MSIYPFGLFPRDCGGHGESPTLALRVWKRLRVEDPDLTERTWFAVGAEVAEDEVEIRVYGMRCSFSGGVGRLLFTLPVKRSALTPEEQTLLLQAEQEEALILAEQEIERQDNEARKERRRTLAASMFPYLFK